MLPDINLLPKYERESSLLFILFISGLIICILLLGLVGYFYFTTKGNLEDTEAQINQLNQEKELLEVRLTNTDNVDVTWTLEDTVFYADQHIIPTSHFIDHLMMMLPENGYLSNYTFNYQSANIETQFETMSDAAQYVAELNKSDFVRNIQVNEIRSFELMNEQSAVEMNKEEMLDITPRYTVSYSIIVDQVYLKEEAEVGE